MNKTKHTLLIRLKKLKKTSITLMLLLFSSLFIYAQQYAPIEDVDILGMHEKVLQQHYPVSFDVLEIKDVFKINEKHSMITYLEHGVYHEVIVNSNRKDLFVVATLEVIPYDEIPDIILDAAKKDSKEQEGEWQIVKALKVKRPDSEWFYAVDMKKKDTYIRKYFDNLGRYKKAPF